MPYSLHYEPAPSDMSLPVLKELPDGVTEESFTLGVVREASGKPTEEGWPHYHFCPHCNGWIEGYPNEFPVNTFAPQHLAGRKGTEYFCRRCGHEIGFLGLMS